MFSINPLRVKYAPFGAITHEIDLLIPYEVHVFGQSIYILCDDLHAPPDSNSSVVDDESAFDKFGNDEDLSEVNDVSVFDVNDIFDVDDISVDNMSSLPVDNVIVVDASFSFKFLVVDAISFVVFFY